MNEHMNKYVNGKREIFRKEEANSKCKRGIRMQTAKRK